MSLCIIISSSSSTSLCIIISTTTIIAISQIDHDLLLLVEPSARITYSCKGSRGPTHRCLQAAYCPELVHVIITIPSLERKGMATGSQSSTNLEPSARITPLTPTRIHADRFVRVDLSSGATTTTVFITGLVVVTTIRKEGWQIHHNQ